MTLLDKEIVGLGCESLDLLQHYYSKRIKSPVCHLFPLPQRAEIHTYGKHTWTDTRLARLLCLKGYADINILASVGNVTADVHNALEENAF